MNINDQVWVEFTEAGLKAYYAESSITVDSKYTSFTLRELMLYFGEYCFKNHDPLFEGNEVHLSAPEKDADISIPQPCILATQALYNDWITSAVANIRSITDDEDYQVDALISLMTEAVYRARLLGLKAPSADKFVP